MSQVQQEPFDLNFKQHLLNQQITKLIHENNSIRMQLWAAKEDHQKMKIKLLTKMGHTYESIQSEVKASQTIELIKMKLLNREQQIMRLQKLVEENHNYVYHRQLIAKYDTIIHLMQQEINFLSRNAETNNSHQPKSGQNSSLKRNLKIMSSMKNIIHKSSKFIQMNKNSENMIDNQKDLKQELGFKNEKKNKQRQKQDDSNIKINQFQKTIAIINKKMQKTQNKLSLLTKQNNDLKIKNKQLQSKLSSIQRASEKCKDVQISDEKKDFHELKRQNKKIKKQGNSLINENKALNYKLAELQAIIQRQQKQMIRFQQHIINKEKQMQMDKTILQMSMKSSLNV